MLSFWPIIPIHTDARSFIAKHLAAEIRVHEYDVCLYYSGPSRNTSIERLLNSIFINIVIWLKCLCMVFYFFLFSYIFFCIWVKLHTQNDIENEYNFSDYI